MGGKLKISDRLRTSRARYPVKDARVAIGKDERRRVEFVFAEEWDDPRPITLEELAGCLRASHDLDADEICSRIAQLARKTGPLFGDASDEAVSDWQLAIDAAQEALRMQQQVNGTRPWSNEAERIVKIVVVDTAGKELFTCYNYLFSIGGTTQGHYSKSIPMSSWVKSFDDGRGGDYIFATRSQEGNVDAFDICLVSCKSALSVALLAQMLCFFNDQPLTRSELLEMGVDRLEGVDVDEVENAAAALDGADAVRFKEEDVGKADMLHVQRIVQAVAALHLQRVTVDLFKSDDTDDSLSFDTFLSSLWYDFAMRAKVVKVGYCAECGKGFSLTNHRGVEKKYCSDECRTKAKNRRERRRVEEARKRYMAGESIREIAKALYPNKGERAATRDIVMALAKWPRLKQAIKAECLSPGDHPFSHRCCKDGIIGSRELELLEAKAERATSKDR